MVSLVAAVISVPPVAMIKTSSPAPPVNLSAPVPPVMVSSKSLPMIVSEAIPSNFLDHQTAIRHSRLLLFPMFPLTIFLLISNTY